MNADRRDTADRNTASLPLKGWNGCFTKKPGWGF